MRKLLATSIWVGLVAAQVSSQATDILDLTLIRPSTSAPSGVFAGSSGGRASSTPVEKAPLEISLVGFDRADYRMSEPVVFRLRIKNVGAEPFPIPWEPDWTRIAVVEGQRIAACAVLLEIIDPQRSKPYLIVVERVFGSLSTTNTLRMLAPGQVVDWIVPTTWTLRSETTQAAFIQTLPRSFSIRVGISFDPQPIEGHWYGPAFSTNNVSVALAPPAGAP